MASLTAPPPAGVKSYAELKIMPGSPRFLTIVIAAAAGALLIQQVMLTRVFSAIVFYHFAFVAVSLTMFGLTLGAIRVFVQWRGYEQQALLEKLPSLLARSSVFSALGVAALLLPEIGIPYLDSVLLAVLVALVFFTQAFVNAGAVIAIILTRFASGVSGLYAADLAGAAVGCWMTILLLDTLGLINSMLLSAAIPGLAGWFAAYSIGQRLQPRTRMALLIAPGLLISGFVIQSTYPERLVLHTVKQRANYIVDYEAWNSYSRITVGKTEIVPPQDQTLAASAIKEAGDVPQKWILIDSNAATALTEFDGDLSKIDFMRRDITASAYALRKPEHVGVIGLGGGRDVLIARLYGARNVTGIEVNRTIFDILTGHYAEFTGFLHRRPGVTLVNDEARGYIARNKEPFDLIQVSLVDTWAAAASGAFALSENGLYTLEAWQDFWNALSPQGMLSFTRWYQPEKHVGELYRMLSLAHNLLEAQGVQHPAQHIAVATYPENHLATLVVSKSPIAPAEAARFSQELEAMGFRAIALPGTAVNGDIKQLIGEGEIPLTAGLDFSPPTDDRPFFFNMLTVSGILRQQNRHQNMLNNSAISLLLLLLAGLTIVAIALIFRPFRRETGSLKARGAGLPFAYFALIGLGFMLVEVPLIQRLSLYLGRPVLALAAVLFGLLLATGMGSAVSGRIRWSKSRMIGLNMLSVTAVALAMNSLTGSTYTWPEPGRIAMSLALTMLPGFCMGMAFPLGLAACQRRGLGDLLPWLWAVNGAASVIGSVLALVIAIFYGITAALFAAVLCYAMAYVVFRKIAAEEWEQIAMIDPPPSDEASREAATTAAV